MLREGNRCECCGEWFPYPENMDMIEHYDGFECEECALAHGRECAPAHGREEEQCN